eukprot:30342-Pelagococcus_subviridis.AAC.3
MTLYAQSVRVRARRSTLRSITPRGQFSRGFDPDTNRPRHRATGAKLASPIRSIAAASQQQAILAPLRPITRPVVLPRQRDVRRPPQPLPLLPRQRHGDVGLLLEAERTVRIRRADAESFHGEAAMQQRGVRARLPRAQVGVDLAHRAPRERL